MPDARSQSDARSLHYVCHCQVMFSLQQTNAESYVPMTVRGRACDEAKQRKIPCKFGSKCRRQGCIYDHRGAPKTPTVCLYHLQGQCIYTETCCFEHVEDPVEQQNIKAVLAQQRCIYGPTCKHRERCLFQHEPHLRQGSVLVKGQHEKHSKKRHEG